MIETTNASNIASGTVPSHRFFYGISPAGEPLAGTLSTAPLPAPVTGHCARINAEGNIEDSFVACNDPSGPIVIYFSEAHSTEQGTNFYLCLFSALIFFILLARMLGYTWKNLGVHFVCRWKGHIPALAEVRRGYFLSNYCKRCGVPLGLYEDIRTFKE